MRASTGRRTRRSEKKKKTKEVAEAEDEEDEVGEEEKLHVLRPACGFDGLVTANGSAAASVGHEKSYVLVLGFPPPPHAGAYKPPSPRYNSNVLYNTYVYGA